MEQKAKTFSEILGVSAFNEPVTNKSDFFVNFSDLRSGFKEDKIYKGFDQNPQSPTRVLFVSGMRGTGKTTEFSVISEKLSRRGFYVVVCELDKELQIQNPQYASILLFQLEKLAEKLDKDGIKVNAEFKESLENWFAERVKETNHLLEKENELTLGVGGSLFGILGKFRDIARGSIKTAETLKKVFDRNFVEFSNKFNEFIQEANRAMREQGRANKVLFIVDGFEKIADHESRKRLLIQDGDKISTAKADLIFSVAIELIPDIQRLAYFSTNISFPNVKVKNKDGSPCEEGVARFKEFILKRVDLSLFDNEETIRDIALLGGGSPRETLRLLEQAYLESENEIIDKEDIEKAAKRLGTQLARYLTKEDFEEIRQLLLANTENRELPHSGVHHDLLERNVIMEYNDGTHRQVNPVLWHAPLFRQEVNHV